MGDTLVQKKAPIVRNEKSAQRVSFGAGYPADIRADIPADVRGQKLRSGPRNPGKTSISVRTSRTRRRGRPRFQGGLKKLRSEKLRAEFSFPKLGPRMVYKWVAGHMRIIPFFELIGWGRCLFVTRVIVSSSTL